MPAYDLADILGQETARRGLEIAAADGLRLHLVGGAGSGASALASCLSGLLPETAEAENARVVDPALAQMEARLQTISSANLQGLPRTPAPRCASGCSPHAHVSLFVRLV